jgi:uncharacterized protein YigE (DUF2233 family)
MVFYPKHLAPIPLLLLVTSFAAAQPVLAQPCEEQTFEEAKFIVCTATPGHDDLRLFWKDAHGDPYRRFPAIAKTVANEGRTLVFAMNAGMYLTDFSPIGLYVENGQELRPASTKTMDGPPGKVPNFYKKPNGVFFLNDADAGILPDDRLSEASTKGAVCHPVRPDARDQKQAESHLHCRIERSNASKRRRSLRRWASQLRDKRGRRELS